MERLGSHMWRYGSAITGFNRSQPSAVKTALLTLPWLVLSAVASDSESFSKSATETSATLNATHELETVVSCRLVPAVGADRVISMPTSLLRTARAGYRR